MNVFDNDEFKVHKFMLFSIITLYIQCISNLENIYLTHTGMNTVNGEILGKIIWNTMKWYNKHMVEKADILKFWNSIKYYEKQFNPSQDTNA